MGESNCVGLMIAMILLICMGNLKVSHGENAKAEDDIDMKECVKLCMPMCTHQTNGSDRACNHGCQLFCHQIDGNDGKAMDPKCNKNCMQKCTEQLKESQPQPSCEAAGESHCSPTATKEDDDGVLPWK